MYFGNDDIVCQVEMIWSSILGLATAEADPEAISWQLDGLLTGCIQITGAWEGAVMLLCPEALARETAAIMFSLPADELSKDLIHDALGELTNITGGNLKALLPATSYLCLPAVVEGNAHHLRILKSRPATQATFRCKDMPFLVSVFERDPLAGQGSKLNCLT